MKFCEKCGKELADDAVVCTGCGCAVKTAVAPAEGYTIAIVGLVLGVIGIVGAWLIALLGYILGGIALGLSIYAKKKAPSSGIATAGIVIACIVLVCAMINSILGVLMVMSVLA